MTRAPELHRLYLCTVPWVRIAVMELVSEVYMLLTGMLCFVVRRLLTYCVMVAPMLEKSKLHGRVVLVPFRARFRGIPTVPGLFSRVRWLTRGLLGHGKFSKCVIPLKYLFVVLLNAALIMLIRCVILCIRSSDARLLDMTSVSALPGNGLNRSRAMVTRLTIRPTLHNGPPVVYVSVPVFEMFMVRYLVRLGFVDIVTVLMLLSLNLVLESVRDMYGMNVLVRV